MCVRVSIFIWVCCLDNGGWLISTKLASHGNDKALTTGLGSVRFSLGVGHEEVSGPRRRSSEPASGFAQDP